jgi:tetratricopeptide (TPR) repeat protein
MSAEQALRRALALRPKFADLRYQLACLLLAQNRSREAREQLEAALDANARYVAARVELALLDAREGFVPEALTALQDLTANVVVKDLPALKLGMNRLERADWEEASSLIRRGFRLNDPELVDRIERFHALMKQENYQGAVDLLREVLPRHDAYPDLHYLTGLAEQQLGTFDDALASFARALELHPDFHSARVQFALTLEAMGMSAAAHDEVALVLQHDPANREAKAFVDAHPRPLPRAA